jgi:hypothetical protein
MVAANLCCSALASASAEVDVSTGWTAVGEMPQPVRSAIASTVVNWHAFLAADRRPGSNCNG